MIQNRLKALPGYSRYQRVADKARNASVSSHAGAAAFFMMLSFLPFTMFLLSLLRFTPITESNLANIIQMIFPLSFGETISSLIGQIYNPNTNTLLPLSAITAVWLGSKSFLVLIRGINDVYEIKESRPFLLVRLLAFFYTFLFAILFVAVLTILVFGNTLYYHLCHIFPLLQSKFLTIISIRPIVGFIVVFLFFVILYYFVPNHKTSLLKQIPGALFTTAGWIIFSYIYSYYVDHFSNYSYFYGTMTTIALLMVWLYACMYLLFLGGILNHLADSSHPSK